MLWFRFLWFKICETSLFLFSFVSDYDNKYKTKKNKNKTGLKIFKPIIDHNNIILYYISYFTFSVQKIFFLFFLFCFVLFLFFCFCFLFQFTNTHINLRK